ncbi:hypothetical protein LZ30DRAFT_693271 [Colletotrichum cereale]|nr:hypothetical protein LZ30DRAFT_693271 [Colletotrichum cereale]
MPSAENHLSPDLLSGYSFLGSPLPNLLLLHPPPYNERHFPNNASLRMAVELPRLKELDRPLSSAVTEPTFRDCNIGRELRGIDQLLNNQLNRLSLSWILTPTATGSISSRKRRKGTHCNVKYTTQQIDFIDYFRVDQHFSWKEVEVKYSAVFPGDAAQGYKRGPQGLQGVYYRKNKQIPVTDPNNLLVFNKDDNPITFQCDVREQGKKNSIGLLGMHPERAITYAWVSEEHKRQCKKLGEVPQWIHYTCS